MEEVAAANSLRYPFVDDDENKSCLGFMELLSVDQNFSSQFDVFETLSSLSSSLISNPVVNSENSEIWNQWPTTPTYSSSTSSEILNGEPNQEGGEKQHQQHTVKTNKQLKTKKTSPKKKDQEQRFAFMTRSEVDHLEDGYRWRKYGQKAVKNSPFPRSYYRCTSVACNVKKRVERCLKDPSIVMTTYEGQHTHPSPIMARSTFFPPPISVTLYDDYPYQNGHSSNFISHPKGFVSSSFHQPCGIASSNRATHLLGATIDHGLLQDITPFQYDELAWRNGPI